MIAPITHYHRAFSNVGLCGGIGPHSLDPTCARCKATLTEEDVAILADAIRKYANHWTAVPLPPDVETRLAQDIPSPPCLDGSTERCVPGTTDVGRCVYCGRGLL